jgi:hypothetical protein
MEMHLIYITPALAQQAHIKEEERWRYFRLDSGKRNIAPPTKATWCRLVSVLLPNGDDVGVPVPWQYPNAFDVVTTDHMHRVRGMAATGKYRKDPQADEWIGHAIAEVVGLDLDDEADKKQVKEILKVWFANGVLATTRRQDDKRRERTFVTPGNWNEDVAPP